MLFLYGRLNLCSCFRLHLCGILVYVTFCCAPSILYRKELKRKQKRPRCCSHSPSSCWIVIWNMRGIRPRFASKASLAQIILLANEICFPVEVLLNTSFPTNTHNEPIHSIAASCSRKVKNLLI